MECTLGASETLVSHAARQYDRTTHILMSMLYAVLPVCWWLRKLHGCLPDCPAVLTRAVCPFRMLQAAGVPERDASDRSAQELPGSRTNLFHREFLA